MACYHPIPGWYSRKTNETGRRSIVFKLADGYSDRPVSIPCGTCIGCQLEKARRWAVRCTHEASLWEENCFLTLTYHPDNLPPGGSLRPEDFVNFMKRLRHQREGIRFFQCGEYGEKLARPHHHALIFNWEFPDKVPWSNRRGQQLWRSPMLEKLWPYGFSSIGRVSFESAGYVARYAMKKVKGSGAAAHYQGKVPEYLTMSRRPGIGRGWIDKNVGDVYPTDTMILNGVPMRPPRYYDNVVERYCPGIVDGVKWRREQEAKDDPELSGKRLVVKEVVKQAAVRNLQREIEATE